MIIIGKPKTILDIKNSQKEFARLNREKTRIAIIDDEEFYYFETLRRHDFNIKKFNDIEDLNSMQNYDIILCDIEGVGTKLSEKYQGAHVIKELRIKYPEKILIAYTSKSFDTTYNEYFKIADFLLKKDIESEQWVENLDIAIKNATDPEYQWLKLRNYLLDMNVPLYILLKLEDNYVKKILYMKGEFPNKNILSLLKPEIKSIIINFASSFIFKMLKG